MAGLRVIVVGYGIQGRKRARVAGGDLVATVDPASEEADVRSIDDVPGSSYDAVLLCIPDEPKVGLIERLLEAGKHVLVEKPLFADAAALARLSALASRKGVVCYTAYNHRFEPHFIRLKQAIDAGKLGKVYAARFYYGNGTARDVRNSEWRDKGGGVVPDLASHLFDTALYLFDCRGTSFDLWSAQRFENKAFDHAVFGTAKGRPTFEMTVSLLSWRNHFTADVYGEEGSAHISSLCKWGPSTFTRYNRKLPSGRPDEESVTLVQADPTWATEYEYFKALCAAGGLSNTDNDIWIQSRLDELSAGFARFPT
jgi:scyllo-inositol 2-dehydrogenase (NADP+)